MLVPTLRRAPFGVVISWVAVVASVVHPPHGMGVPLCPSQLVTGLPCPGCGVSRSMSCAVRGDLGWSIHYNPAGLVFLVLFLSIAVLSVAPGARRRVVASCARSKRPIEVLVILLMASWLAFGIYRMIRFERGDTTVLAGPEQGGQPWVP